MNFQKQEKRDSTKKQLARLFFISIGVFLFILFFQPFPLEKLDYENRLLYITGFGVITFLLGFIVFVLIQVLFSKWFELNQWESMPFLIPSVFLLIFTATAFTFYIHFVGNTSLTLYIILKIFLVCLLPIIILAILYKNKSLELIINTLQEQNKLYISKLKKIEKNGIDDKVEILSENKFEKFIIKYKDIITIQSADNYIKIFYLRKGVVENKLIRNTLKNIESQLIHKREFIRCHRTRIVNTKYINGLVRNYSGYVLEMSNLDEDIPVSRQYLILIKDALSEIE